MHPRRQVISKAVRFWWRPQPRCCTLRLCCAVQQVPPQLKAAFLQAVDAGRIRSMQNKSMPAAPLHHPGALLLGEQRQHADHLVGWSLPYVCAKHCRTLTTPQYVMHIGDQVLQPALLTLAAHQCGQGASARNVPQATHSTCGTR